MTRPWVACSLWFAGAALLAGILLVQDWSALGPAFTGVGWGMTAIVAAHLAPLLADSRAWASLLPAAERPGFLRVAHMRWLGESVNSLLPAVQVGGDLLRARLLQAAGVPGARSGASVLVNVTLTVATLLVFNLIGVGAAALSGPPSPGLTAIAGGVAVGIVAVCGFAAVQRTGLIGHALARIGRLAAAAGLGPFGSSPVNLNRAITELYSRHGALWRSAGWSLAAWIAGTLEIRLILHFIGVDAGWREALVLESLIQAIRNAAFVVPGALGVQDGGAMLLGPLVGVEPGSALMVSILKRVRELALGVPGLVVAYLLLGRNGRAASRNRELPPGATETSSEVAP